MVHCLENQDFKCSKLSKLLNIATKSVAITVLTIPYSFSTTASDEATSASNKEFEVIEVKGIRNSILKAQHIKRNAESVVDAISADDLGKFSDAAISDAIQRIPGVQIERNDGGQEGDRVSIRGLGPTYVTSTVNGRTAISAGTEGLHNLRSFNLEVIPTDIISSVIVKKTPTASDPESGIAGSIDLETRRPLDGSAYRDDKNYFGSLTIQGDRGTIGDEWGERYSATFGARSNDETLGFFITYLDSESFPGRDQLFPTLIQGDIMVDDNRNGILDNGETRSGVNYISAIDFEPIRETQLRESWAGAVEWRASDDLNIIIDHVFTSYDNASIRNRVAPFYGNAIANTLFDPDDIEIRNNMLQSVNKGGFASDQTVGITFIPFLFRNKTESTITGINFEYQVTPQLSMNVDLHQSTVDYFQDLDLPLLVQNIPASQVSFTTDNGLFSSDLGNVDNANYAYPNSTSLVRDVFMKGDQKGAKVDFKYLFDNGTIESIEFGLRYTEDEIESIRTNIMDVHGNLTDEQLYAIGQMGFGGRDNVDYDFFSGDNVFNDFPDADFSVFCQQVAALCQQNYLGKDPSSTFSFNEDVFAIYGEVNTVGNLFDLDFTANVGVRAVNVKFEGFGLGVKPDGTVSDTATDNDYWEFLPSGNINFDLSDQIALRFGAAKVMSRPNPSDLVPREAANQPSSPEDIPSAQRGNAKLDPTISYIFDTTFEYYNDYEGAYTVSLFYKDVNDFIFPITTKETLPGEGTQIFDVRTPQNYSDGNVKGFEVGFNQPFVFLPEPFDGFGLQANYTYSNSDFDSDVGDNGFGFPGSSKNNFNSILYFEKGRFGIRLSYIYRDDYFRNLPGQGAQAENASAVFTESDERLNANASYDINEHLTLFIDVNNISEEGRRDFFLNKDIFNGSFNRERTVTVGITGRL